MTPTPAEQVIAYLILTTTGILALLTLGILTTAALTARRRTPR